MTALAPPFLADWAPSAQESFGWFHETLAHGNWLTSQGESIHWTVTDPTDSYARSPSIGIGAVSRQFSSLFRVRMGIPDAELIWGSPRKLFLWVRSRGSGASTGLVIRLVWADSALMIDNVTLPHGTAFGTQGWEFTVPSLITASGHMNTLGVEILGYNDAAVTRTVDVSRLWVRFQGTPYSDYVPPGGPERSRQWIGQSSGRLWLGQSDNEGVLTGKRMV